MTHDALAHRRIAVLDGPLHGAGGGHGPPARRPLPHAARAVAADLPAALGLDHHASAASTSDSSSVYSEATPQTVFEFLGFREDNPNSIVGCVTRVRENARTIRDRISRELWEDVNSFYHRLRGFRAAIGDPRRPPSLLQRGEVLEPSVPRRRRRHVAARRRAGSSSAPAGRSNAPKKPPASSTSSTTRCSRADRRTSRTTTSGWRC